MNASKPYIGFGCFFHGKGKERDMRIQDMVFVIKNIKGKEINMLMTLEEYKEAGGKRLEMYVMLEEYNMDVNGGTKVLCSIMSRKSMSLSRGKFCIT